MHLVHSKFLDLWSEKYTLKCWLTLVLHLINLESDLENKNKQMILVQFFDNRNLTKYSEFEKDLQSDD